MAHWTEKRACKALLGQALRARGWLLFGWHDDASDSMTDLYNPASWSGIGTKNGVTIAVDASTYSVEHDSGRQEIHRVSTDGDPCERCEGSGREKDWTLALARANPAAFSKAQIVARHGENSPVVDLFPSVVSPLHFHGDGSGKCFACSGRGHKPGKVIEKPGVLWPTFQATPKGSVWHVERDGKIFARGRGLYSTKENVAKIEALAAEIDAVAMGPMNRAPIVASTSSVVRASKIRAGFVELEFPSKPGPEVLAELKAAGFRWAVRARCWYGSERALPDCYRKQGAA